MSTEPEWSIPDQILGGASAPIGAWPNHLSEPNLLGFDVRDGVIHRPSNWQPIDQEHLCAAINPATREWITDLSIVGVTGSTNTDLVERASVKSIDGVVRVAELQLAGRGRRGRQWSTPLGGSLALSMGWEWPGHLAELGGLSVVIGLAAIDALEQCGYPGVKLKWPNDLWVDRAKLGGILIELVQARNAVSVIIGIGLNIRLSDSQKAGVEQLTSSLFEMDPDRVPDRSAIAAALVNGIRGFTRAFAERGLAGFVTVFNAHHALHNQEVVTLEGESARPGTALGLASDGGLMIRRSDGAEEIIYGGEVSVRPI